MKTTTKLELGANIHINSFLIKQTTIKIRREFKITKDFTFTIKLIKIQLKMNLTKHKSKTPKKSIDEICLKHLKVP